MAEKLLFVVDDDVHQRKILSVLLKSKGFAVRDFDCGEACLKALDENPAIVFLDMVMPGLGGEQTLKKIKEAREDLPVIMVTNVDDVATVVRLIQLGAHDYILKPVEEARLIASLEKASQQNALSSQVRHLQEELLGAHQFAGVIGKSPALEKVLEKVQKVKDSKATVFIQGESGTGKELLARAIHYNSRFAKGLFVDINCGAIPETLQDSELFGHKKGAFTGAVESRIGKIELADGGTLFLDEVAEMNLKTQTKLLRVLQERSFTRIGENKKISVDLRIIAATNKNLKREVELKNFREDLYYRLAVYPIEVPPLRQRKEDIAHLCVHILKKYKEELGKEVHTIAPGAMKALMGHSWPGNVRELENVVYQAMINTNSNTLDVESLPEEIFSVSQATESKDAPAQAQNQNPALLPWDELQKQAAVSALELTGGNIPQAAKKLGLSRSTFYRMVKKLGIR